MSSTPSSSSSSWTMSSTSGSTTITSTTGTTTSLSPSSSQTYTQTTTTTATDVPCSGFATNYFTSSICNFQTSTANSVPCSDVGCMFTEEIAGPSVLIQKTYADDCSTVSTTWHSEITQHIQPSSPIPIQHLCTEAYANMDRVSYSRSLTTGTVTKHQTITFVLDRDPCQDVPCQNGGSCTRHGTSFKCECAGPWRGRVCDKPSPVLPTDECPSSWNRRYRRDWMRGSDSYSRKIKIPINFPFGYSDQKKLWVHSDGFVMFGRPRWLRRLSKNYMSRRGYSFVAPFAVDMDFYRSRGCVVWRGFEHYSKRKQHTLEAVYRETVTNAVRTLDADFTPTHTLVVTWKDAAAYSSYRYRYQYYWYYNQTGKTDEKMTVQMLLTTDGDKSYVVVNYGRNSWSNSTRRRFTPVVGFSDHDVNIRRPFYRDWTDELGSELFDLSEKPGPTRDTSGNAVPGRFVFKITPPDRPTRDDYEFMCSAWLDEAGIRRPIQSPKTCPSTTRQIWWDRRYRWRRNSWNSDIEERNNVKIYRYRYCYDRRRNNRVNGNFTTTKTRHFCCYSASYKLVRNSTNSWWRFSSWTPPALITEGQHAGFVFDNESPASKQQDFIGHDYCCKRTRNCPQFHEFRPVVTDENYVPPPRPAFTRGDPHFRTLDGKMFTFNGLGEYVFLRTTDNSFKIQCRTGKAESRSGDQSGATVFTAFAAATATSDTVEIGLNASRTGLSVLLNKTVSVDVATLTENGTSYNGVDLIRTQNGSIVAAFDNDFSLEVGCNAKLHLLTAVLTPSDEKLGEVEGLVGFWNNDTSDDLRARNGSVLPANSTERTIFNDFGQSWAVANASESLFAYTAGDFASYRNASFVPLFIDELKDNLLAMFNNNATLMNQAHAICNASDNYYACMYDSARMSTTEAAESDVHEQQAEKEREAEMNNRPPRLDMDPVLNLKRNQTANFNLNVTDPDGDEVNVTVQIIGPSDTVVYSVNTSLLSLTPYSHQGYTVAVTAVDSKNAAVTRQLTVRQCDCQNDGVCQYNETETTSDQWMDVPCDCLGTYTGEKCEVNPCELEPEPCYEDVACQVVNYTYSCDPCPQGMTGDGRKCEDIDECIETPWVCDEVCINQDATYQCACNTSGYVLSASNRSKCIDLDECSLNVHNCPGGEVCVNTDPGYSCQCQSGYARTDVGLCADVNECQATPHPCDVNANCTNTDGSFTCTCRRGFSGNGSHCSDINECSSAVQNSCQQRCLNVPGSYSCQCDSGFSLNADNQTCTVTSACVSDPGCTNVCVRQNNADVCVCPQGQELAGDGITCQDIDECSGSHACDHICINQSPGYSCSCRNGYLLQANGQTCINIDECQTNPCSVNANCTDTDGSYTCTCHTGFTGDGVTCTDIDECAAGSCSAPNTECVNYPGSYGCYCAKRTHGDPRVGCTKGTLNYGAAIRLLTVFNPDLSNRASQAFNQLRQKIENAVTNQLSVTHARSFAGVTVTGCRAGSTVVDVEMTFTGSNSSSGAPTSTSLTNSLNAMSTEFSPGSCAIPDVGSVDCAGSATAYDPDECADGSVTCSDTKTECLNTQGSAECVCKSGYLANGYKSDGTTPNCQDINECPNGCTQVNTTCTNTEGSFTCACLTGYTSNNPYTQPCQEMCSTTPCLNEGACVMDSGSTNGYRCVCLAGYSGSLCETSDAQNTGMIIGIAVGVAVAAVLAIGIVAAVAAKFSNIAKTARPKSAGSVYPEGFENPTNTNAGSAADINTYGPKLAWSGANQA